MSVPIYLISLGVLFGSILILFGMRYLSAYQQSRARIAHEASYRTIAEKSVATQSETAASLAALQVALADVRARVASIETILKQVE